LDDTAWCAEWSTGSWRTEWSLVSDWSLESSLSLIAVLSILSWNALWSAWSLLSGASLVAGWSGWADDARLVGDGALQDVSVASIRTILTIVTVSTVLSLVSGSSWWPSGSLLARAAGWRWLRVDDAIALSLLAMLSVLLLQKGHLRPHVTRASLAELSLGDHVALKTGHVAVQHWKGDDAGDDGRSRHHNGEKGHTSELTMLVRLILIL